MLEMCFVDGETAFLGLKLISVACVFRPRFINSHLSVMFNEDQRSQHLQFHLVVEHMKVL